jgi:hypothetical protein
VRRWRIDLRKNKKVRPGELTQVAQHGPASEQGGSAATLLQTQPASLEQLRRFAEGGYLFAILDSADQPKVPEKAHELGERAVSLFLGSAQEDYSAVAPYLIRVDPPALDWIVENLWTEPWGVFVMSKSDLDTLRTHFRRFLIVQLPDGEKWFFRFYDPRILAPYLTACRQWELGKFFGPVRAYALHDVETGQVTFVQRNFQEEAASPSVVDTDPRATLLWTITAEQVEALSRTHSQEFERRMIARLKQTYFKDNKDATPEVLQRFVRYGMSKSGKYGIQAEADVARYIELMAVWGPDFDADERIAWAGQLLRDAALTPPQKLDLILEKTQFGR